MKNNGGNAKQAALTAGYSQKSAHEIGRQLLEKPHVHQRILQELQRLRYRSGVIGLNALVQIAQDDQIAANARVNAAKALCEHAGLMKQQDETQFDVNRHNSMMLMKSVLQSSHEMLIESHER